MSAIHRCIVLFRQMNETMEIIFLQGTKLLESIQGTKLLESIQGTILLESIQGTKLLDGTQVTLSCWRA
jgi:hypothetical protein